MTNQYFAVGDAIVSQLRSNFSDDELIAIYTPFDIDDVAQVVNASPSACVIYLGDRVGDDAGRGKVTTVYQQWLVVLAIHDASAQLEYTHSIREKASPLIVKLLAALQGFNPNVDGVRELRRVTASVRGGSSAGFAYFPFMFETQLFL